MIKNPYSLSIAQLVEAIRKYATDKSPEDFAEFIGVPYLRYRFVVHYDDMFDLDEMGIIFNKLRHLETSITWICLMNRSESRHETKTANRDSQCDVDVKVD